MNLLKVFSRHLLTTRATDTEWNFLSTYGITDYFINLYHDGPLNHNGFYAWAESGGSLRNYKAYNNHIGPGFGSYATAGLFVSGDIGNVLIFNNLLVAATNDLMAELQKDSIKLDDESEKKVVRMVLRLLEDKNGEVQNLAVKCLGPLVNKVKEIQVETIVDSLCGNMISNSEQLRDISSIGLKTVISELPQTSNSLAPNVCQRITGKLSSAIEKVIRDRKLYCAYCCDLPCFVLFFQ